MNRSFLIISVFSYQISYHIWVILNQENIFLLDWLNFQILPLHLIQVSTPPITMMMKISGTLLDLLLSTFIWLFPFLNFYHLLVCIVKNRDPNFIHNFHHKLNYHIYFLQLVRNITINSMKMLYYILHLEFNF